MKSCLLIYKSKISFKLLYNIGYVFVIIELILYCQISFPNLHILFHPLLSVSFISERLLLEFSSYAMCNNAVYAVLYYSELNIFNLQFLYKN